jgi:hypothetical protein
MSPRFFASRALAIAAPPVLALMLACGGGSSSSPSVSQSSPSPTATKGNVNFLVTDAPADNWADIGVIIRGIWLVPTNQGESAKVLAYDGSKSTTQTNLVQLDSVAQLLANTSIAAGSYDRAIIEIDGAAANVTLAPSLDANGNPQNPIATSQILVKGNTDSATGWIQVPTIKLSATLDVSGTGAQAVNLDFDLASPLFVVTHDLPNGTTYYVVNFVVRHKAQTHIDALVLHRNDGTVTATSTTTTPNTLTLQTLEGSTLVYNVDSSNGTIFYNLDATTVAANVSTTLPADLLPGTTSAPLYARATARFQDDGSLWAVRVWYSATESKLPTWAPEGHITKVDASNGFIWVLNDDGQPIKFAITPSTNFYYQGGTTAIGSDVSFLANVARGFKVQVTANALTTPMTATDVDIQRAVYDGAITAANANTFTVVKALYGVTNTYTVGYDPNFLWWNFAFPTVNSTSVSLFDAQATATAGNVAAPIIADGTTSLNWLGGTTAWDSVNMIFEPAAISTAIQTVSTSYASGSMGLNYTAYLSNGTALPNTPVAVNLDTTVGSQPVVTLYSRGTNNVTVQSLTSDQWATYLVQGAKVRVYGIPNASTTNAADTLNAYVINIFN